MPGDSDDNHHDDDDDDDEDGDELAKLPLITGTNCHILFCLTTDTWARKKEAGGSVADFPAVFFHICNFDICHEI